MKKLLLLAALLAVVWFFKEDYAPAAEPGTDLVAEAYANQASGLQVSGHEPGWLRHRGRTYQ